MFQYSQETQFFKTVFPDGLVRALSIADSPLRSRITYSSTWGGDSVKSVPMQYALPQARSRNAPTAINERFQASAALAQWVMKGGYDYATFRIKYTDILRSRENPMAFGHLIQLALKTTVMSLNHSINRAIYRDGVGSFAQIASVTTTTNTNDTLNLLSAADAYLMEPGMFIQFYNSVGSANQPNLLNGGETRQILAVNPEAGSITVDNNAGLIAGLGANTYIIQNGDGQGFGSTQEDGNLVGLAAYLPLTAPVSGDNLWGQDRSFYTVKLAGHRKNAQGLVLWEEVQRMQARISRLGGHPGSLYLAPEQLQNMIVGRDNLTENFREVQRVGGDDGQGGEVYQEVGFSGVRIRTPGGTVNCYPDPFAPADRVYLLQDDCWHLPTMGEFPHMVMMGNVGGLLQEGDDYALQGRYYASGQYYTDAPAYQGVIQVTPVF